MIRIQLLSIAVAAAGLAGPFETAGWKATQESIRTVDKPGEFAKYLTPGMVDRWIFKAQENETIVVRLVTSEFDSVVQLVQTVGEDEKVLRKIDDDGSNCWLSFRLPEDGEYKILVCGCEGKGGGNYTLSLQQFCATPIEIGGSVAGTFAGDGQAFFYFQSQADQFLTVDLETGHASTWAVLDPQGKPIETWLQLVGLKRSGEYVVALQGRAGQRFELRIPLAQRVAWSDLQETEGQVAAGEAAILDIPGKAGEFRVIEIHSERELNSRIVFAPPEDVQLDRLDRSPERPELASLPIASKGDDTRYAVIWGRNARFQLQLFSIHGATYQCRVSSSDEVQANQTRTAQLPVGNARFYQLAMEQGQTVTAHAGSTDFDPFLRLFDSFGREVRSDDDGGGGKNSRLQYTAYAQETVLVAVASFGDGGGGAFELGVATESANAVELEQKYVRQVAAGATEQWLINGKQGQTVIVQINHRQSSPEVVLRNANGVELLRATSTPEAKGVVFAYEFPSDGRYSLWVTIPAGGAYTLRASDADQ